MATTAHSIDTIREYWNSHLNLTQFLDPKDINLDPEYFYHVIEQRIRDRHAYKYELLRDFSNGCQGKKLLEVGCGLGVELAWLGKFGFDVTGIDLAPAAVERAAGHLRRLNINGRTIVQNVEQMQFADESFDAIYSSGVLQHTPDIQRAIGEMIRVLRPGGKMLIILYHRHSWFYCLQRLTHTNIEFDDRDAPIINAYTRNEVKLLFSKLRNIMVTCEYFRPKPTNKTGFVPLLYNYGFVPGSRIIPSVIMKNFGWHLVLTGVK
jgi:ubiquinone/menaquinone biosynthesis C-methylase UbiE